MLVRVCTEGKNGAEVFVVARSIVIAAGTTGNRYQLCVAAAIEKPSRRNVINSRRLISAVSTLSSMAKLLCHGRSVMQITTLGKSWICTERCRMLTGD
jgi:hypothetical protein